MTALLSRCSVLAALYILIFCGPTIAFAQEVQTKLNEEIESYEKEIQAAKDDYAKRLAEVKKKHLDSLQKLKAEATQNDELDIALKIREQTDQVSKNDLTGEKFDLIKARNQLVNTLSRSMWLTGDTNWEWSKPGFYFHPSGVMYPWGTDPDLDDPDLVRWAPIGPKTIVMIGTYGHVDMIEFNHDVSEFRMLRLGQVRREPDPMWAAIKRKLVDPPKSAK